MQCTPNTPVVAGSPAVVESICWLPKPISQRWQRICTSSGAEPPPNCRDWQRAQTCNKGHGRLEQGELIASTELNEWLAATWPGVEQREQVRCQTKYGISSLLPKRAAASRLLALLRAHWRIENRLHWRRDVTLGEDHSQVRKGADSPSPVGASCPGTK